MPQMPADDGPESWLSSADLRTVDRAMAIRDAEIARLEGLLNAIDAKHQAREAFLRGQTAAERSAHEDTRLELVQWKRRALAAERRTYPAPIRPKHRTTFTDRGPIE